MTFLLVKLTATLVFLNLSQAKVYTSINIDNHPCKPENLKTSNRYICDSEGNVVCQSGWKEPEERSELNDLNPCLEPICEGGCSHGQCKSPNFCACDIGWEGRHCDVCIPLPGCAHGHCSEAFECSCESGWEGAYCDMPQCSNCTNGYCPAPDQCVCNEGWSGPDCDQCQTLPGCVNGKCGSQPNTCVCEIGWEGHLCDQPVCTPPCVNGKCTQGSDSSPNVCLCESGWQGAACTKCVPYWECPNQNNDACIVPNQCFCFGNEPDPRNLCNNTNLPHLKLPVPIFAPGVTLTP